MSDRYVRSNKGRRTWYRVALGPGAALPYREIVEQMGERINRAQADIEEWAREDPTVDMEAELSQTTVVKLNDLADAFGVTPTIFRNELKKLNIQPLFEACEQHSRKRCDCKLARMLTVAEVQLLMVYGRDVYYRMVRRPGRVKVVTPGRAA